MTETVGGPAAYGWELRGLPECRCHLGLRHGFEKMEAAAIRWLRERDRNPVIVPFEAAFADR